MFSQRESFAVSRNLYVRRRKTTRLLLQNTACRRKERAPFSIVVAFLVDAQRSNCMQCSSCRHFVIETLSIKIVGEVFFMNDLGIPIAVFFIFCRGDVQSRVGINVQGFDTVCQTVYVGKE
jgi:hypothetical protein